MAVVTKYAPGYPDPGNNYQSTSMEAGQPVKSALFEVAVANGDSIASSHYFARLPSNAIILPASSLYCSAITGVTSYSVGVTNRKGVSVANALINAQTLEAAATVSLVANVGAANLRKRLWQLLGLANDPGGLLHVYGSMNAAATAAGVITGVILYQVAGA